MTSRWSGQESMAGSSERPPRCRDGNDFGGVIGSSDRPTFAAIVLRTAVIEYKQRTSRHT